MRTQPGAAQQTPDARRLSLAPAHDEGRGCSTPNRCGKALTFARHHPPRAPLSQRPPISPLVAAMVPPQPRAENDARPLRSPCVGHGAPPPVVIEVKPLSLERLARPPTAGLRTSQALRLDSGIRAQPENGTTQMEERPLQPSPC